MKPAILILFFGLFLRPAPLQAVDEMQDKTSQVESQTPQKRKVIELTLEEAIQTRIRKKIKEEKSVTRITPAKVDLPTPPTAEPVFDELIEDIDNQAW